MPGRRPLLGGVAVGGERGNHPVLVRPHLGGRLSVDDDSRGGRLGDGWTCKCFTLVFLLFIAGLRFFSFLVVF